METTNNKDKQSSSNDAKQTGNDKFLITRSKRKYDKPTIKVVYQNKSENSNKSETRNSVLTEKVQKGKRETIHSLNSKINEANDFLSQLNKKLEDREREINDLKKVISSDRNRSIDKNLK